MIALFKNLEQLPQLPQTLEKMEKQTKAHLDHQIMSIQMAANAEEYSNDFKETENILNTSWEDLEKVEAATNLTLKEKRVFSNVLRKKIRKGVLRLSIFLHNDALTARCINNIKVIDAKIVS